MSCYLFNEERNIVVQVHEPLVLKDWYPLNLSSPWNYNGRAWACASPFPHKCKHTEFVEFLYWCNFGIASLITVHGTAHGEKDVNKTAIVKLQFVGQIKSFFHIIGISD